MEDRRRGEREDRGGKEEREGGRERGREGGRKEREGRVRRGGRNEGLRGEGTQLQQISDLTNRPSTAKSLH